MPVILESFFYICCHFTQVVVKEILIFGSADVFYISSLGKISASHLYLYSQLSNSRCILL